MKTNSLKLFFLVLVLFRSAIFPDLYGQKEITIDANKDSDNESKNSKIVINYSSDNAAGEESYKSGASRLIDNPAISSGLAQGSNSINHSIELLMESVFYSILDREFYYDITDHSLFKFKTQRELFPTNEGSYVVVDRFSIGPEYSKPLYYMNKIPVSLGVEGKVNVLSIYLRSDAMRAAENQEQPFFKRVLNNWFGILPLLTAILPPSFNPNELYDPVSVVTTPFSFPLTVGGFYSMPVGSIRSYNISGGVRLPAALNEGISNFFREGLERFENLNVSVPYSIFVEGEYRINVLRKSENVAWVGLSTSKTAGHKIESEIGSVLMALNKVSPYWVGVPVKFLPIDLELKKAKVLTMNQLYELNLNKSKARAAYRLAVKGDFTEVYKQHKLKKETGADNGVLFHFTRHENAWQGEKERATNLAIYSRTNRDKKVQAEVKIVEDKGVSHVLEARKEFRNETADALTGKVSIRTDAEIEMNVIKIPRKQSLFSETLIEDKEEIYAFPPNRNDRYSLVISQRIQDKYLDAFEYNQYLKTLRFLTFLELKDVPKLSLRDPIETLKRRQIAALSDPSEDQFILHTTPSYVGRFGANAAISFSFEALESIFNAPINQKWHALAIAYGLDPEFWKTRQSREGAWRIPRWALYGVNITLSLFNIRQAEWDFIAEANGMIESMNSIRDADTPSEVLDGFYDLFDTAHPEKLTHAFLLLSKMDEIPRSVTFSSQPKAKHLSKEKKKEFKELHNRTIRTVIDFPAPPIAKITKEKLNAFFPDEVQERRKRPGIIRAEVSALSLPSDTIKKMKNDREIMNQYKLNEILRPQVYLKLNLNGVLDSPQISLFIKCEQAGKLQLGKFVLSEKVFKIEPKISTLNPEGVRIYEFYLTGPTSPLASSFFNNAINFGGEFQFTISASADGRSWSEERIINISYENGVITPP